MAAHRKNPPPNAIEIIEQLAGKGYSTIGLAKHFNVARSVIMRWFKAEDGEDNQYEEAYQRGRDSYRQSIEERIIEMGSAGKNPAGLIYILKACFKMYDVPPSGTKVDVAVNAPQSVLVVKDHGSDEQWAAKVAEQQRKLTIDASTPAQLQAPQSQLEQPEYPWTRNESAAFVAARPEPSCEAPAWKPRR